MNGRQKRIGLALGGGAVLGGAHIGVIRALEEASIPIHALAGTSIGALVGALYAFGKSWEELLEIAEEIDWFSVSRFAPSQYGLLSNERIRDVMHRALGEVTIEEAPIPMAIVAADIGSGEKVVLRQGDVGDAVMASTCIPGVFAPVTMNDRMLIDGGLVENVPVHSLRRLCVDRTIGVDLYARHRLSKPGNIIELLHNVASVKLIHASTLERSPVDLLIAPDLSDFNAFDTDQLPQLVEEGYREARKRLPLLLEGESL
ncbi:MAG: patatin-like phospholipase family protein [Synergistales bacterium]|nr:patatin-like phospholipase family protein [Synergistales bacterium]